jgi:nitrogenase iron protein NifH
MPGGGVPDPGKKIDANEMRVIPTPLEIEELEKLLIDYGIAA